MWPAKRPATEWETQMNLLDAPPPSAAGSPMDEPPGGLSVSRDGAVATLWLDRPEKLNAMNREFWPELRRRLGDLAADDAIRAIVITGRGDRAFSAGGDIASFDVLEDDAARRAFQVDCMETFVAVERCPLPVIAAVNGLALGGGCELAMACDVVLAERSAQFGMPEANLGLVPGYGIVRAPVVIGRQWTNWLVMSGERIDATTAAAIGLVQRVTEDGAVLGEALRIAARIAGLSRDGMVATKALSGAPTSPARLEDSIETLSRLHSGADGREGRRAFLERRPPVFGRGV